MGKKPLAGVLGLCLGLGLTGCESDSYSKGGTNWNRPVTGSARGPAGGMGTSSEAAWRTPAGSSGMTPTGGMASSSVGTSGGFERVNNGMPSTGSPQSSMVTPGRMDSGTAASGNYQTISPSGSMTSGSRTMGGEPTRVQSDFPPVNDPPVARSLPSTPIREVSAPPAVHGGSVNEVPLSPPPPPGPPSLSSGNQHPLPPIGTGSAPEMPSPPPLPLPSANDPPPLPSGMSPSPVKGTGPALSIPTPPPGVQR